MPPDLSIIVPAYNEARRIGPSLDQIAAYLRSQMYSWELIVVDDGSKDETAEMVSRHIGNVAEARLISYQPNRGKGFAVRTGVLAANGKWIVFLDADLSTPPEEIANALQHLRSGYDMVIGSRALPDSKVEAKQPPLRRLGTFIFNLVKHLLVGLWQFSDTQCGFKAYRQNAVRPLYERSVIDRFMFDVEILYLAERKRLRVYEMPVRWADSAGSKVRFLEGLTNMFKDLVRIRWMHRGI
ncbi:MAG TPA: dolichyl-phosphate beta-glucosyltransferase [Anaerolineales bacterium]|nr:dolichyl-phosphate beta-glucosyltransferase [Anaerolineales bacterium]